MEEKSFDWLSLDDDEQIIWSGKPKMNSIYPSIAVGILFTPVMGIGLLIMAGAYLYIQNTNFVITSNGLYKKTGIASRKVKKIGFNKIQDTSFNQGIFGNYFGYGNVDISTAGGQNVEMRFNSIDKPKEIQELISKETKTEGNKKNREDGEEASEIIEELSNIREILEEINNKI